MLPSEAASAEPEGVPERIDRSGGPPAAGTAGPCGWGHDGAMTAIGPVSAADAGRAQRKAAPFRQLEEVPSMFPARVTFTEQDLHAHQPPVVQIPLPPQISLRERLDLSRPITNTTALITVAMTASLPEPAVTARRYLEAEVHTFT
jgi:hypothetical protein